MRALGKRRRSPRLRRFDWRKAPMVGLGGLEPPTSRLSSARSNQLSYKPERCTQAASATLRGLVQEERETKTAASRDYRPDWPLYSKRSDKRAAIMDRIS